METEANPKACKNHPIALLVTPQDNADI